MAEGWVRVHYLRWGAAYDERMPHDSIRIAAHRLFSLDPVGTID